MLAPGEGVWASEHTDADRSPEIILVGSNMVKGAREYQKKKVSNLFLDPMEVWSCVPKVPLECLLFICMQKK